jgi:peptide/nickel transport system substrate-binding protein
MSSFQRYSALVLACFLIVACSQENHKAVIPATPGKAAAVDLTPAYGDVLVLSSIGDASTLIPMLASDASSHEVAGFLFNGLVKYDKDYNIVGDLARSWDIENDGKLLRFHLRNDVLWHDGQKFTARDVMFTYKLIIDPKTPTAYAEKYKLVKKARIIDEYTFEVEYDKPLAPALISWGALQILPEHILKDQDITKTPFARAPVGTGPFTFVSWQTGQKVTVKANEKYFDGMPYLTGINYRIIPDQNTEFLELKAGSIDMMGLTPLQYLRQTETPEFNRLFTKYKFLSDGYTYLGFNLKKKPFDDKLVRQAISYAIDRDEIIKGVLNGLGEPTTGPYKPGTTWFNTNVTKYPYSPDKARELLMQAGYLDRNGDGYVEKDGHNLTITIITNQGNPLREKTAQIIQQRLKAVGIGVKIRIIEWTVFLKEYVDKGNFDAVILGWNILQDPDLYNVWHSSQAVKGGLNFVNYKDPEVDKLLEDGRQTYDKTKRKKCYDRFQEILADQQPYIFLYVPYSLPAVSSRIKGIVPAPAGITYNIEKWYVPKGLQKYTALQ